MVVWYSGFLHDITEILLKVALNTITLTLLDTIFQEDQPNLDKIDPVVLEMPRV
jgi:hypothetical protein